MKSAYRKLVWFPAALLLLAGALSAQTGAVEGDIKGEDGNLVAKGDCKKGQGACVKLERTDIKGNYMTAADKKGHYFHAGLPLGNYNLTLEIDGKPVDNVKGVRTRLGDPTPVHFDLSIKARKAQAMKKAAETGTITKEQSREMTPEQKAAMEKAMKDRAAAMQKNKALNDAFNAGMDAMKGQQWEQAVEAFNKAAEMDSKQHVIYAQLAESHMGVAAKKTGDEQMGAWTKGLEAYAKAIELKPDDAAYHNNYALALVKAKKLKEAQEELGKAADLDKPNAGRYFYNLGAVLVNTGQTEAACEAFKKGIEADPKYADAHYQLGNCLFARATTTNDGKVIPQPGTRESFEEYLKLKPDGPFAQNAKDMIGVLEATVATEFKNPNAPGQKKSAPKKK
ncbi:MAG: tetratricopeptide repeat protein [Candidatus Solibacter usitatus]|nr:tetratricopeptide repeat protein [Candidatus Solibacter usitatus]